MKNKKRLYGYLIAVINHDNANDIIHNKKINVCGF